MPSRRIWRHLERAHARIAPAAKSGTPLDTTAVTDTAAYYEWDVTEFVRPQLNAGASVVTLILEGDARNFQGNSREAASNPPQLTLQ